MINLNYLRENLEETKAGIARKGAKADLDELVEKLAAFNQIQKEIEELRAKQNKAAEARDVEVGKKLKAELAEIEKKGKAAYAAMEEIWRTVPNVPASDVPDGGEEQSKVLATVGVRTDIAEPKDHIELGTKLNILDIDRATKIAGSRFYYLKNEGVELEFALVRWIFDVLKGEGFELMVGPQLVNREVMEAAGYLGQAEDEIYKTDDDLYLIGTSEQTLLGYHMDEVIEAPKRYAAFSSCFRREAGSYGKDVKGIIRTHQFDKVEMFSYVEPDNSEREHEFLVSLQEEILQKLEIPYQKVLIAAGDLGMPANKKFDLESWIPSQNRYRETHSCSNCTDWQSRRARIRYKTAEGKNDFVHTLNGTAVAIGRLLVALMENHQQPDGSIKVPAILHPYLSFKEIRVKS